MIRSRSIANKVYKYVHDTDVSIETNLKPEEFENDFLRIKSDGTITVKGSVKDGYAWDGCSPKKEILDLLWGTPDGKLDYRTEKPMTYYASMIHDAVYQFKGEVDISRREADRIFLLILKESKFFWARLYGFGVRVGGRFYGKWRKKKSTKIVKIFKSSWIVEEVVDEELQLK